MKILLHTSKTMKQKATGLPGTTTPLFLEQATELMAALQALSVDDISRVMHVSHKLAVEVQKIHEVWSAVPSLQSQAVDTFVGDIYSGLQAAEWSASDIVYAQEHLYILSGLYGILRPQDGIMPYRLEMGYAFKGSSWKNLYEFWSPHLKTMFVPSDVLVNLSAVEYTKALLPYVSGVDVIQPYFMTISPKTGKPVFVVVHAKIARGAFASWLIKNRLKDKAELCQFNELGYHYSAELSEPNKPVFICEEFKGIGLSVRLK